VPSGGQASATGQGPIASDGNQHSGPATPSVNGSKTPVANGGQSSATPTGNSSGGGGGGEVLAGPGGTTVNPTSVVNSPSITSPKTGSSSSCCSATGTASATSPNSTQTQSTSSDPGGLVVTSYIYNGQVQYSISSSGSGNVPQSPPLQLGGSSYANPSIPHSGNASAAAPAPPEIFSDITFNRDGTITSTDTYRVGNQDIEQTQTRIPRSDAGYVSLDAPAPGDKITDSETTTKTYNPNDWTQPPTVASSNDAAPEPVTNASADPAAGSAAPAAVEPGASSGGSAAPGSAVPDNHAGTTQADAGQPPSSPDASIGNQNLPSAAPGMGAGTDKSQASGNAPAGVADNGPADSGDAKVVDQTNGMVKQTFSDFKQNAKDRANAAMNPFRQEWNTMKQVLGQGQNLQNMQTDSLQNSDNQMNGK
jgi:hypothetical protein